MDELKVIGEIIKTLGPVGTIGFILYAMAKAGYIKLWGIKNGDTAEHHKVVLEELRHMREHYNEELTDKLEKLGTQFGEHLQIEKENQFYLKQILEVLNKKQ